MKEENFVTSIARGWFLYSEEALYTHTLAQLRTFWVVEQIFFLRVSCDY